MKKITNPIKFLFAFLLFFVLDYCFSNFIAAKLLGGWEFSNSILNLVYEENTGAAFSLMQNSTTFLIVLSLIALLAILYYVIKNSDALRKTSILFLALLGAGILGNLIERLIFGYVRDFFELAFVNFPIFNISDVFINIGVAGIIILILLAKKPIKIL